MLMQLMLLDVLSEATVPEVTLIAHAPANAGGAPPPIISAANDDDDANRRSDRRAKRRRIEPAKFSVGMKAFDQVAEPALDGENDGGEVLAIVGIAGLRLRVQRGLASLQQRARYDRRLGYRSLFSPYPRWPDMVNRRLRSPSG